MKHFSLAFGRFGQLTVLLLAAISSSAQFTGGDHGTVWTGQALNYRYSSSTWSPSSPIGITTGSNVVNNLYVDASSTLTISSNTTARRLEAGVGSNISVPSGVTFTVTDTLVLEANTSVYSQYSGNAVNLKLKQYVGGVGWHCLAAPVASAPYSFLGEVGSDHPLISDNVLLWNASTSGWEIVDDGSVTTDPARGFMVWTEAPWGVFSGPGIVTLSGTSVSSATASIGYHNGVGVSTGFAGAVTDGWNLVANPFPCVIDFYDSDLDKTNLDNSFHIWNPEDGGNYIASALADPGDNSGLIPPMQSFWVRRNTSGSGSLNFSVYNLTASGTPAVYKSSSNQDRFVLFAAEAGNPNRKDRLSVVPIPGTTDGLDADWDAAKQANGPEVPNIFSLGGGIALAINAVDYGPGRSDTKTIPLGFRSASKHQEQYSITLNTDQIYNNYLLELEDLLTGTVHNLMNGPYTFVNDTGLTARFLLHINATGISIEENRSEPQVIGYFQGDVLKLAVAGANGMATGRICDLSGKTLWESPLDLNSGEYRLIPLQLPAGVYVLSLTGSSWFTSIKMLK